MTLAIIAPRLPPAIDGIGDYCHQLWCHCSQKAGRDLPWQFVVVDGGKDSKTKFPNLTVDEIGTDAAALSNALTSSRADTVLVQYVGYGYSADGAPTWLHEALADWRAGDASRRLIIMFHETWSSGKPWRRVFWQMPRQIKCVGSLVDISDCLVTSMQPNVRSIKKIRPNADVRIIPIGSSFDLAPAGELDYKSLLIFGKEHSRSIAIKRHAKLIKRLQSENLISRIIIAGQRNGEQVHWLRRLAPNVSVESCFDFAPNAIPDPILRCGLSLMHTESPNLLKSTSFQLCAQLGQVGIALDQGPTDEPFRNGIHYIGYERGKEGVVCMYLREPERLQTMSKNLIDDGQLYLSWDSIASRWVDLLTTIELRDPG